MAVVINEFEVVVETPTQGQPAGAAPAEQPAAASTPRDIERLVRRQLERLVRVWAH